MQSHDITKNDKFLKGHSGLESANLMEKRRAPQKISGTEGDTRRAHMAVPRPIDLKQAFGDKYRVFCDEPFFDENGELWDKRLQQRWHYELRGKHGIVYPYSANDLVASVSNSRIRFTLKRMGLKILQWGDSEGSFLFTPERLEEIAEPLRLKKKRILSSEQKEDLKKRLAA